MTNEQTIQSFIEGKKDHGHNSTHSIYFDGDVLYSYGSHFPLAVRYTRDDGSQLYFVNEDRYSNTTTNHQSGTRWQLHQLGHEVIELDTKSMKLIADYVNYDWGSTDIPTFKKTSVEYLQAEYKHALSKADRARKEHMRDIWLSDAGEKLNQINAIKSL